MWQEQLQMVAATGEHNSLMLELAGSSLTADWQADFLECAFNKPLTLTHYRVSYDRSNEKMVVTTGEWGPISLRGC